MKRHATRDRPRMLWRIALGATALSLWAYIPYRYATRPPGFEGVLGSAYAALFPVAALFALGALLVAHRPRRLDQVARSSALRWGVGVYGATWLAMGMLCVPSLTATAAVAPLKGAISMIHMTAQHVFLGLAAVGAAWRPEAVEGVLDGRPPRALRRGRLEDSPAA